MISAKLLPHTISRYYRTLTPHRAWNATKVVTSYFLSQIARRDIRMGRPFVLMVEPTNICNLKCPLCPSGNGQLTRPRGSMELGAFERILQEHGDDLLLLLLWNQGEPFINKHLIDMIRLAKERNITTITSTNVHYIRTREVAAALVSSGIDEIILSLDGATPETYEKYRVGGNFDRVLEGAKLLIEAKKEADADNPLVHLQFIIMKHNEHEIEAARSIAKELGVDRLSLKTAQVYTDEEAEEFLPTEESHSRYRFDSESLTTKGKITNTCRHLWYSTVINWDGVVSPCCFDKDVHYGLGDALNGQTFDEIWSGEPYTQFRNRILEDRSSIPICNNCSEGLKGLFYEIEKVN